MNIKIFFAIILLSVFSTNVFSQEKLKADGEIPIVAWVGVPGQESTVERFKELKESGININFTFYANIEEVEKALNAAQKAGVKIMPFCPELKAEPEKTVKRLMHHPALSGYHLKDEPGAKEFPELGAWVKRIQAIDAKHYCYINLHPSWAPSSVLGVESYTQFLEEYIREIPLSFISFDHYPIYMENGTRKLRPEFYKNLEEIAAASKKSGLPFWAFSLSVAHYGYPIPTIGDMKLQMYSNLAYGAQVLQYFTYWCPETTEVDFNHAMVDGGKRTLVYDRVKALNTEIQNLAGVFLGAKVISVKHTGKQLPDGTQRLDKLPEHIKTLDTGESGAVVSLLQNKSKRFLVIVNHDCVHAMNLTFEADNQVKRVLKDGTLVPANAYSSEYLVDPGDAVIFAWENK